MHVGCRYCININWPCVCPSLCYSYQDFSLAWHFFATRSHETFKSSPVTHMETNARLIRSIPGNLLMICPDQPRETCGHVTGGDTPAIPEFLYGIEGWRMRQKDKWHHPGMSCKPGLWQEENCECNIVRIKSQNVLDFTLFVAFPCLAQVFQGISGHQGRRLLFITFCLIQNTTSVGPTVWLLKRWTRFEKCSLSMVQKYMLTSGRNPKIKAPILLQNKRAPPALQSFARVTSSDGLRTVDSRRPQISSDAHSAPFF